ncbi:MAG: hypothetical protein KKE50_04515 [Nanoarchaeota archaeon]|nr:hypothetical protein [Nanoarchaeota archaeon]
MAENNFLTVVAVIAVVLSLLNVGIILINAPVIKDRITGFASSGYVNVTVSTQITINLTTDTINWGAGTINAGQENASLNTNGALTATVLRGNWTTTPTAIVIANIGNVNASLTLGAGKTAATFFGGSAGDQAYQWNVSNKDVGSCNGGTEVMNTWRNVNSTAVPGKFCAQFGTLLAANEIYLDIKLVIPKLATLTGAQSDMITVTADPAG